jgi:hypothetical protein
MFESLTAVFLLIVFLVPGFVWRTVEGQFVYLDKRLEWEKFAFGLLTRSTFVYLPFSSLIYAGYKGNWLDTHPLWTAIAALTFIAVIPCIYGFLWGVACQGNGVRSFIRHLAPEPSERGDYRTAWDYLFSTIRPCWVVVTLKNGNKIYGYLSPASYFSSDAEDRDMYISHVLHLTDSGKFKFAEGTLGVYVKADEVSLIEFTEQT